MMTPATYLARLRASAARMDSRFLCNGWNLSQKESGNPGSNPDTTIVITNEGVLIFLS
jgi:hypothetical protein